MAFQEKSAWVMLVALTLGGLFYLSVVNSMSAEIGQLAPPILPILIIYTIILVVLSIIGHIAIAIMSPKDANTPLDEREKTIFHRAGHYSAFLLGAGVLLSLGYYLLFRNGDVLFYGVFASLVIAQMAEYAIRIFLYRVVI